MNVVDPLGPYLFAESPPEGESPVEPSSAESPNGRSYSKVVTVAGCAFLTLALVAATASRWQHFATWQKGVTVSCILISTAATAYLLYTSVESRRTSSREIAAEEPLVAPVPAAGLEPNQQAAELYRNFAPPLQRVAPRGAHMIPILPKRSLSFEADQVFLRRVDSDQPVAFFNAEGASSFSENAREALWNHRNQICFFLDPAAHPQRVQEMLTEAKDNYLHHFDGNRLIWNRQGPRYYPTTGEGGEHLYTTPLFADGQIDLYYGAEYYEHDRKPSISFCKYQISTYTEDVEETTIEGYNHYPFEIIGDANGLQLRNEQETFIYTGALTTDHWRAQSGAGISRKNLALLDCALQLLANLAYPQ